MKTSHLIPYLMTIAVITGCIKEEGEPYTIERNINKERTIVSSLKGYMYGTALPDSLIENTFQTLENNDLDVYISLESDFDTIEVKFNAVKECGYVYSPTNATPTVKGEDCKTFKKENIKWKGDTTSTSLHFSGEEHGLLFNHNYFVRSYVVTTKGDTCYNPTPRQIKTVIPSNVWFRRKEARLSGRSDAIAATTDGGINYIYGGRGNMECFSDMWVYNATDDTWEQKATFNSKDAYSLSLPVERCNGAAFMYTGTEMDADTLMYILGGEDFNGSPTKNNFIYSLKHNRFGNSADHPNGRQYVEPFDLPRTGLTAFKIEAPWGEIFYAVGMGLTQIEGTSSSAIETQIFQYDVSWDKLAMIEKDGKQEVDPRHVHTWTTLGSLSTDGNKAIDQTAIGFYQSTAIQLDSKSVIIGSGEGSDGNYGKRFYQVSINSERELDMNPLVLPPDEFKPRKNAASFYLKYEKDGAQYNRFFVGTGSDKDGHPLNDFWAYEFGTRKWERIADCGNYYREGAVGFKILRVDDYFVKEFAEPQERGIVAFGVGTDNSTDLIIDCKARNDVWEYLP